MDHFEIVRDGEVVKTLAATNTASAHNYTYTDANLTNGRTYKYELYSVSVNNARELQKTASVSPNADAALVTEYALHQNYPNPFNPNTKIAFDLVSNNVVTLTIYNATGQEVATVLNGAQYTSGRHSVNFDAANLPSGLYFYTVKIGSEFSATKKMLLLK
jgi:flagellar hook assembly protein FlgD